jgi:hypothetical protein
VIKCFISFFIFSLFLISSNAQVRFGLKSGLNISNFYGDDAQNLDSKLGFTGGIFLSIKTPKQLIIQPEITYSVKGSIANLGSDKITLDYHYIDIPILFKYVIPLNDNKDIKPAIFAGPFIGFKTRAQINVNSNGKSESQNIESAAPREYGFQFGGALGFNLGNNELGIDIRYVLGLTKIDKSPNNYDVRNGVFNFNLYVCFAEDN